MRASILVAVGLMAAALGACGHRSSADVTAAPGAPAPASAAAAGPAKNAEQVVLTEADITDRKYVSLGDITVSVSKNTIFDPDPTQAMVGKKLREKAAEMGADAVVLARYGAVGISFFSWGTMDGRGRAVRFVQ